MLARQLILNLKALAVIDDDTNRSLEHMINKTRRVVLRKSHQRVLWALAPANANQEEQRNDFTIIRTSSNSRHANEHALLASGIRDKYWALTYTDLLVIECPYLSMHWNLLIRKRCAILGLYFLGAMMRLHMPRCFRKYSAKQYNSRIRGS